jgi:uncharacterized protein
MALLLDLTQIRGARDHIERRFPADAFAAREDEFRVVGDVVLSFDIEKQDDRYRLVGTVRSELELPCSRCLEPMNWPVEASFDLRYLPSSSNTGDPEREIPAEDLGVAFYESETIDLGQLVREQFYLALPMKPLCRPDCAGLCPECGANSNVERCECEHRWVDPRMAALGQLLPKDPPKE